MQELAGSSPARETPTGTYIQWGPVIGGAIIGAAVISVLMTFAAALGLPDAERRVTQVMESARKAASKARRTGVVMGFMTGHALFTGIARPERAEAVPRALMDRRFSRSGYAISVEDERWLGKVNQTEHFLDVI